jgi:hypothetical protein
MKFPTTIRKFYTYGILGDLIDFMREDRDDPIALALDVLMYVFVAIPFTVCALPLYLIGRALQAVIR